MNDSNTPMDNENLSQNENISSNVPINDNDNLEEPINNDTPPKKKPVSIPKTSKARKIISVTLCVLFLIFTFLCSATLYGAYWITDNYDETTFEQILFNLLMPLKGVDKALVYSALVNIVIPALLVTLAAAVVYVPLTIIFGFGIVFNKKEKVIDPESGNTVVVKSPAFAIRDRWYLRIIRMVCWVLISTILSRGLLYADSKFGLFAYLDAQFASSSFIEDNYVDPDSVDLIFPEKKKNLIYIFLESTETSFLSKQNGGSFGKTVIPELEGMMLDPSNVHFSNTNTLGGAISTYGASWTIAGMFAQSSGLPLKLPIGYENMMGISESFFATTTCLGDILDENGYNQALMVGSNSYFGGRNQYYTAHGNQTIYDLYSAKADGIIDDDYYQNYWGMSDVDLYEYAKQVLGELSADDEPFAFTFLTVDTHFPSGFPCEECVEFRKDGDGNYLLDSNGNRRPQRYNYDPSNQYCNVFRCASKQIYEFVEWLKVQDYFEDTTIVIAGDHLTMDAGFSNRIPDTYTRTPVNLIINSSVSPYNSKNREFATVDMFPTTLAAMGVTFEGDRLGLGTNLFSNRKTLVEEMGLEAYEDALLQKSNFYNSLLFEQ